MWKLLQKLKNLFIYDADREFYAKIFPGSVPKEDLLRIRKMDHADLETILKIEEQNYEFPWPEGIFLDCFRTPTYTNWVIESSEDEVIGYSIISVAAFEAHVMNISISQRYQGQGAGRKMMQHLIEYARPRAEKIFLEVRPSNSGAIRLYQKLGFKEIGVRKAYYPAKTGREDAIMFGLDLVPML